MNLHFYEHDDGIQEEQSIQNSINKGAIGPKLLTCEPKHFF